MHANSSPTAGEARQIRKPTLYYSSPSVFEVRSPNAQLFATEQDHNLAIRRSNDNSIDRLTEDGTEKAFWSVRGASWSPDSQLLVASKVDQTQESTVPVVRWLEGGEPVDRFPVDTVGKSFGQKELWIANVQTKQLTRVDAGNDPWVFLPPFNWTADSSTFFVLREDSFAKHMDLLAADALTGTTKLILSETSSTFINTEFEDPLWLFDGGRSFFWLSDRTGWKGIYLYRANGTLVRRITEDATAVVRLMQLQPNPHFWPASTG